jgi:hypothetical protein
MSAVSLVSPQTLNLYSYCGNDPINHTDPSGLFFKKLFKWIKKILKWIVVAVVIAVAVIALVVSPQAAVAFLKVLATFLTKIGIFKATPIIMNLAEGAVVTGVKIGLGALGKALVGLYGVGAVASHFAKGKKVKLSGNLLKRYGTAWKNALSLLKNPNSACFQFLKDHGFDPNVVAKNLTAHTPYDLLKSTNKESFGLLSLKNLQTIKPNAATSDSGNTYYTRNGLTTPILIHETLHRLNPSASDLDIAKQLGISEQTYNSSGKGSTIIDDALKDGGCK